MSACLRYFIHSCLLPAPPSIYTTQSLQLAQAYLSHEKYATEARAHIDELERELHELRAAQSTADAQATTSASLGSAASTVKENSKSFLGRWWA